MLKRKIEDKLIWWKSNRAQALLVTGARQVGKTYSILDFCKNNFSNVIYINFAVRTDLIGLFAELKSSDELLLRLSLIEGKKMVPGKTIIFFDEIQLLYRRREELKKAQKLDIGSQDILTSMKALVIEAKYRFVLSGSLLGVELNDITLYPAGYLDIEHMYPLDFEEYLWAKGVGRDVIDDLRRRFLQREAVDESLNKVLLSYFREYVLIGGMPEAVCSYISDKNLYKVDVVHKNIINSYLHDMTTYVEDKAEKLRIREVYKSIPSELNSKNKRFMSSHVMDKNYLKRKNLEDEFVWLAGAGVAIPVYNATEPQSPLVLSSERRTFKFFMSDTGLLGASMSAFDFREKLLKGETEINFGAPYENTAATELYAHGFEEGLFYYNSKKHGEIDFLVEWNGTVLPIEIKSGKPNQMNVYNHCALSNVIKLYEIKEAFLFGECNIRKESECVWDFPIYMLSFLTRN